MKPITSFPLVLLSALALSSGLCFAQLSIDRYTIDGGGHAFSVGGEFSLGGTVGQPDAGTVSGGGLSIAGGFWLGGGAAVGVLEPDDAGPFAFRVAPAWPNPFSRATYLALELPAAAPLEACIFDSSGRLVTRLHEPSVPAGPHRISWDGNDARGNRVSSGVYFVKVQAGNRSASRRVLLLR